VEPSKFPETLDKASFSSPAEYAIANAKGKSLAVAERMKVHAEPVTELLNIL